MTVFLGIDLGTTGTKVALFHPEEGVVGTHTIPCQTISLHPGWAEADTNEWWKNICLLIPAVLREAGLTSNEVGGVAVSGMVPAVIPLDEDGSALRHAILQNDARACQQIEALKIAIPDEQDLLMRTGSAITQQSVAPTLIWLRENEKDTWEKTKSIAGSYDWLSRRLGASAHVEFNWGLESGLFERSGDIAQDVMQAAQIPQGIIPSIEQPGAIVGHVSTEAAAECGLNPGTPIVVGGADHVLSAFAAGLSENGDWLIKLGGAGDILVATDTPFVDERLYLDAHPQSGMWMPNGCMATSGSLIRWNQSLVSGDGPLVSLQTLDKEAEKSHPVSLIMLPYFLGEKSPLHDPLLRGAIAGMHLGTTRGDLHRGILEAIAYGFRQHVEIFSEHNIDLGIARVTNGGSKSTLWKEILASVLNRELVSVRDHPGSSLGAAFVAAVGLSAVTGWSSVNQYIQFEAPIEPDHSQVVIYNEGYEMFLEMSQTLTPISHRLSRMAES